MDSVPRPDKIDIYIDDAAVARGEVNHRSVRVEIEWREAEEVTPIVAARAEWPPPVKADLVPLECADGRMELFPKSTLEKWRRVGVGDGSNFTSFYDMARRSPEGMREPGLTEAIQFASELIRQYLPGFDAYSPEGAEFLARTIDRIDEVSESLNDLAKHLQYAAPGGRKAVEPAKNPGRDVQAAVLRDVHDRSTLRIGQELGVRASSDSTIKGENQAVRKMINERGRPLLEWAFGAEGWKARVERMRAARGRVERVRAARLGKWGSMGSDRELSKQEFYALVAEYRATSPEEEEHAAKEDGFDETLGQWMKAWAQEDYGRAMSLQLSDRRFSALRVLD